MSHPHKDVLQASARQVWLFGWISLRPTNDQSGVLENWNIEDITFEWYSEWVIRKYL